MNSTGKYFRSKYKSSGSKVWNPPSSQRFYKSSTGVPGAGNYHPVNEMSDSGYYVLSSHKGQGKRRFDKEFRDNFVDEPAKITKSMYVFMQLLDRVRIGNLRNLGSMTICSRRVSCSDAFYRLAFLIVS